MINYEGVTHEGAERARTKSEEPSVLASSRQLHKLGAVGDAHVFFRCSCAATS